MDALAIAKSGLDRYLGDVNFDYCLRPIRPPDGDSVRVNTTGGYADVVARVVRRPTDTLATWMYVVRSTGRVIHPSAGSEPQAVRTIAQFAEWHPAHITVPAAFTAANGLVRDAGGDGEFKGRDQASPSSCRLPDIHAIRTPDGGAPSSTSGFDFNGRTPYVLADETADHIVDTTGIGWATLYNGDLEADYDYIKPGDTSYPFMYIDGDHTLDADNTWVYGTLVVTGDLTITGGRLQWYGVVLVGGVIDFNSADQRFDGAVFTGLNERL
ncbi:MAG: hypothetical protein GWN73_05735, partial [Actinobacteria bacterium]|nr:hypothetical protein [Actinomycetota bacterium]NIS29630.1 hypothetical protein [Actinomycetota bacterium]NIU64955.1 hypothetical protein [Actinomycetota bacterium]NIW26767.1 hypothetical protein [Actinomycetota bacterium]